ncbi:uncharacterized protein LOC143259371 [Megalopta genalis]|uniref:uncharacterized protein LOC143259371 n=1 Tax=Megalopta genalis TaxID=115081 RepID=UPI003FD47BAE
MIATFAVIATIAMATGVFSNAIPNDCPPDESSVIMRYPHECLCQQYYNCSREEKVLQGCFLGMLFDRNSSSCVPFDAADFSHCDDELPSAWKCPSDGVITLPHETDCTLYYRCQNGQKSLRYCRGGLHFDHLKGLCIWQDSARCARNIGLNLCPPAGSNRSANLPHPCLCDRYYKCADGVPILKKCPPGLQFDYVREICDDPHNFKCVRPIPEIPTTTQTPTTSTTTQSPTTPTTTQTPTTTITTQSPTTPTTTQTPTTTITTQSPTTPTTTQTPTTITTTQSPTTPTTTQTPTTTITTQSPTTPTTTQTPTTITTTQSPTTPTTTQTVTTTITTQSSTTPTTTQTPTTTTTTQSPTTPTTTQTPTTITTTQSPTTPTTTQTVTTTTTTQSPTTPTTTQTPTTTTTTQSPTTPTTTQTPSTPTTTQTPTTPTSSDCPIDCSGKVRLPNPVDCSSYYECYHGRKALLRCSSGLRYNRVADTCDWSWNVVC